MKKKLRLMCLAFFVLFVASTVQAQTWTKNGRYKISVPDKDLFITINVTTGALEWAAELSDNDPKQVWNIVDHRKPASAGYMEITASIPDVGDFSMGTKPENIEGKNITLTANPGLPVGDDEDAKYGYDQFQRRKTSPPPASGNNALFIKVPREDGSRFGVAPTAAGDPVKFDSGGIDELVFTWVGDPTSIKEIDAKKSTNLVYPNPSTTGIFNLKESTDWAVYSISGSVVAKGKGQLVDISSSPKGVYMIKYDGITQKIMY